MTEPVFPDVLDDDGSRIDIRLSRFKRGGVRLVERVWPNAPAWSIRSSTFDGVLYRFLDGYGRESVYDGAQIDALKKLT